jgi:hypothetical protein
VNIVPLADILEDAWDAQLFRGPKALANVLGWKLCYHTLRSKGSRAGFPDRVLIRERVVFAELKRERAKPTPAQIEWLDGLAAAGAETYLWRPSDLEEIGLILAHRREFVPSLGGIRVIGAPGEQPVFPPKSLWIAGRGRRDAG